MTLEYAGYAGQQIKQADVNLLGYPLGVVTDRGLLLRDLAYYDAKIDRVNGPAMAFSVFCVQYAWLGDAAKAEEMFRRCYRPTCGPRSGCWPRLRPRTTPISPPAPEECSRPL